MNEVKNDNKKDVYSLNNNNEQGYNVNASDKYEMAQFNQMNDGNISEIDKMQIKGIAEIICHEKDEKDVKNLGKKIWLKYE